MPFNEREERGMSIDQCGNEVTGVSAATIHRFDDAVRSLPLFADDVGETSAKVKPSLEREDEL